MEARPIKTLPPEIRADGTHVLIYFRTPALWMVCKWDDDEDDDYCWLVIGSSNDHWSDDEAEFWSPLPTIANKDLMRLAAQEGE